MMIGPFEPRTDDFSGRWESAPKAAGALVIRLFGLLPTSDDCGRLCIVPWEVANQADAAYIYNIYYLLYMCIYINMYIYTHTHTRASNRLGVWCGWPFPSFCEGRHCWCDGLCRRPALSPFAARKWLRLKDGTLQSAAMAENDSGVALMSGLDKPRFPWVQDQ